MFLLFLQTSDYSWNCLSGLGSSFHLVVLKVGENSKNQRHDRRSGKHVFWWDTKMLVYLPLVQRGTFVTVHKSLHKEQ